MNKLKIMSIAVCCLVSALWSGTQCMDAPEEINGGVSESYSNVKKSIESFNNFLVSNNALEFPRYLIKNISYDNYILQFRRTDDFKNNVFLSTEAPVAENYKYWESIQIQRDLYCIRNYGEKMRSWGVDDYDTKKQLTVYKSGYVPDLFLRSKVEGENYFKFETINSEGNGTGFYLRSDKIDQSSPNIYIHASTYSEEEKHHYWWEMKK